MRRVLEEVSGGLLILAGTCLLLFLAWIGAGFLEGFFSDGNELVSKQEWSVVQAAAASHRDTRLVEPRVIRDARTQDGEARTLLGVPAKDGSGNVWMLLNPKTASEPKTLPEKDFELTPAQFAGIEKEVGSKEVKKFLKGHVMHY